MVSDNYQDLMNLLIDIDTEEGFDDVRDLMNETDKAAREWERTKRKIVIELNQTLGMINSVINIYKNAVIAMGGTLNPMQEAYLSIISTTISTMQSVATAYATMGPVGWGAALIIGLATIAFSISAQMAALEGVADARRQLSAVQRTLEGLSTLGRQF